MNIGEVFLTVRADLTKLNSEISRSATTLGNSLQGVGRTLSTTGAAMTRNLTLPIVAAGAAVNHFALDFDTKMRQIVGLTDVTADQVGELSEQILAMGSEVGRGPQELAEAFYFVASAGFDASESMEVLETSAKAAASGMGTTQDVARVLAGVINAYGHENLSAAVAADQLTAAVQKGSAEAADFAGVIGRVAPGAAALGISFDQVTAALAGMTNVGISADEAATSLVNIFSSLLKPTTQADAAMEGLGLSAAGLRRQLREEGLLDTLRTLEERFGNNETASAAVFGNIRALRGITALLGIDTEQLNAIFATTADSLGSLEQAYAETEGPQRELDRAMAEMQSTAIALGQDVLPVVVDIFKELAAGARELGKLWASLDGGTKRAIVQFLAITAAAGPVLFIFGKLVGAFGALFKAVGFLTGPKGLATLPARISAVMKVAGRVAPILLLVETLLKLPDAFGAVEDAIDGFSRNAPLKVIRALRQLNDAMPPLFNSTSAITAAWLDEMEKQFLQAAEIPEGTFSGWGERSGPIIRPIEDAIDTVATVLEDGSVAVGNAADAGLGDPIAEAMAEARRKVAEDLKGLLSDIESSLAAAPEDIEDEMQAILDALVDPFTDAERVVALRGALLSDALAKGLRSGDTLLETQTFNQINDWLHQWELADPAIFDTGAGFLDQLTDGMESNLQTAVDWVAQKMGIEFVSKWDLANQLEAAGFAGLAAFVRGMETQRPTAEQKARAAAQRINTSLSTGANWYGGGEGIAIAWANGLSSPRATTAAKQAANRLLMAVKPYLIGDSPPPVGPLSTVDEGGEAVAEAWGMGLVGGLHSFLSSLSSELGMFGSAMALTPGFTGLSPYPAQTVPAAAPATPVGGVVNNNNYNLHVTGRLDVDEAQDALDELRRLQTLSLQSRA